MPPRTAEATCPFAAAHKTAIRKPHAERPSDHACCRTVTITLESMCLLLTAANGHHGASGRWHVRSFLAFRVWPGCCGVVIGGWPGLSTRSLSVATFWNRSIAPVRPPRRIVGTTSMMQAIQPPRSRAGGGRAGGHGRTHREVRWPAVGSHRHGRACGDPTRACRPAPDHSRRT